jgi:hypothetical protein
MGPAPGGAPLALSLSVAGPVEAFDRADRLAVKVLAGNVVVLDTVIAFQSRGEDVRIRLRVPNGHEDESGAVQVEVRQGTRPLFTGGATNVSLSGTGEAVPITLRPVVAAIAVPAGAPTITAIGGTITLAAAAVFATGDTIPNIPLTWTSLDPAILSVTSAGVVRGRAEGTGRIEVRAENVAAVVSVVVRATVATVSLVPDRATIVLGGQQAFTATARDAAGNALLRTFTWTSTNPGVFAVDNTGRGTGLSIGTATVRATADAVSGAATVTVVAPLPATPTSLAAQSSGTTVRLTWVDNATDESSYEVHRGIAGSTQRVRVATLGPNATSYTESAPGPDLVLEYVVLACNATGCSASTPITARTVPLPPVNLAVVILNTSTGAIRLDWEDKSKTEVEFFIEIGDSDLNYIFYKAVPANTTFLETTVPLYELLYFRVAACNAAGCSDFSNEVDVYVQIPVPLLGARIPGPAAPVRRTGPASTEGRRQP